MKRAVVSMIALFLVACGSSGADQIAADSSVSLGESTAVPGPQAFTTQPMDESQPEFVPSEDFTTGVFQHACGTFSLVQNSLEISLMRESKGNWEAVENTGFVLPESAELVDHRVLDVTGDGEPEVILVWYPEFSSHTYGHVLTAGESDCAWIYAPIVRGCGADSLTADLEISPNGKLSTFEFLACSGGYRDELPLVWNDLLRVFLAEPPSGFPYCESFSDEALDLPVGLCSGGWVVGMGQEALALKGIDVDRDGRFGPGTRLATLSYQRANNLELTGVLDEATWATMYPVGGPSGDNFSEFPDFDGDGISSPREIGHAAGLED